MRIEIELSFDALSDAAPLRDLSVLLDKRDGTLPRVLSRKQELLSEALRRARSFARARHALKDDVENVCIWIVEGGEKPLYEVPLVGPPILVEE